MKNPRRVAGWAVIAVGSAALLVGVSPIFPVFVEAFLVGGALIATGVWLLSGKDLRAAFGQGSGGADQRAGPAGRSSRRRAAVVIDPLLPARILELARARGGVLSVSDAAKELGVSQAHAEAGLEACVRAGDAQPDWDVARGYMLYRFPGFSPPEGGREGPRR
jgi:hypothetical protein